MPTCVVKWCRSNTRFKCLGITFHGFPADPIRNNKWIAAVKLERQENGWMPMKTSRVCSVHFDENDFYKSIKGYTMLHKTAVPVCTMVRPEGTSKSFRDNTENEKINNSKRLQLDHENSPSANFEACDLPELLNKTNIADPQAHKAQKRKLRNNIDPECNDGVAEETRIKKNENNPGLTEVHSLEERGPCFTPIKIPTSDIESALNITKIHILKKKLRIKSILAAKRLSQIRNLKRKNKRLTIKNISLKNILSQLKNNWHKF